MPSSAARSEPTASITARTSSIRSSSEATPLTRSDRPVPRLSNRISRPIARGGGRRRDLLALPAGWKCTPSRGRARGRADRRRAPGRRSRRRRSRRSVTARSGPGPRRGSRPPRGAEERVLLQDAALQRAQPGGRLEPELLVERRAERPVGAERLGLAAGAVEAEHQLAAQPLAQRVARDERLELADHFACPPSAMSASIRSSGTRAGAPRAAPPPRARTAPRTRPARPAPQRERLAQPLGGLGRSPRRQRRPSSVAQRRSARGRARRARCAASSRAGASGAPRRAAACAAARRRCAPSSPPTRPGSWPTGRPRAGQRPRSGRPPAAAGPVARAGQPAPELERFPGAVEHLHRTPDAVVHSVAAHANAAAGRLPSVNRALARHLCTGPLMPDPSTLFQSHAMGAAVTGVTVVTTITDGRPIGRTVSAMCSVSADPPLLLAPIHSDSPLVRAITARGAFAVNVLSDRQAALAEDFAGRGEVRPGLRGARLVAVDRRRRTAVRHGAAARFRCDVASLPSSGTHTLVLGAVAPVRSAAPQPRSPPPGVATSRR